MKYCSKCGTKLNLDSSFCDNCGNEITKEKNSKTEDESKASNIKDRNRQELLEVFKSCSKCYSAFCVSLSVVLVFMFAFDDFTRNNTTRENFIPIFGVVVIIVGIVIYKLYDFLVDVLSN